MKEAMLYEKLENKMVKCNVCNHRCVIKEGKRGICRVRENSDGILYALNYGKAVAVHVDPIEKKPLYHFMPGSSAYSIGTEGCNMKCTWCQNWQISQSPAADNDVRGRDISPKEIVQGALEHDCESIAYTYTEPTIFLEYALETMKLAKEKGIKNVWVSNGYMTRETLDEITPYLDAANIDHKGPNKLYKKHTGGSVEAIEENLKYLHEAGVHLEVTTLLIPGLNDEDDDLKNIAEFISRELSPDVPWHISRFYPGWKMKDIQITPMKALKKAKKIGEEAGLKYIHLGNV
ncbi:MAG: AmmeMemoRadiSam system radical SAM enzyme [Halanaerobiales bacterium]|nr:AmmeMemoRadiSam system radical SAM enzyme [Halanaerobiales bacterium]